MADGVFSRLGQLKIPNGATRSNIVSSGLYRDARAVALIANGTIAGAGHVLMVHPNAGVTDKNDAGWANLMIGDPAADAAPPATGKARVYTELAVVGAFMAKVNADPLADVIWEVSKN